MMPKKTILLVGGKTMLQVLAQGGGPNITKAEGRRQVQQAALIRQSRTPLRFGTAAQGKSRERARSVQKLHSKPQAGQRRERSREAVNTAPATFLNSNASIPFVACSSGGKTHFIPT
jgi:hypothetical protein